MLDKLTPQMIEDITAIAPVIMDLAALVKTQGTQKIIVDIKVAEGAGLRQYSFHEIYREEKAKPYQRYARGKGCGYDWDPISEEDYNFCMNVPFLQNMFEFKIEYAGFAE